MTQLFFLFFIFNFIAPERVYARFSPLVLNIKQQGDIIHLNFDNMNAFEPTEIIFNQKICPFFKEQNQFIAICAIDFKINPNNYNLIIYSFGRIIDICRITVINGNFSDEKLWVDKKFLDFTPEILTRIQKEKKDLEKIFNSRPSKKIFIGNFIKPLNKVYITSQFGTRRIYNDFTAGRHGGIDYRAWYGTPIKAINSGIIKLAKHHYLPGKMILIDHGLGIFSSYLHLSKIRVKTGDIVKKGEIIGYAGSTGRVTGPHLDLRIKIHGATINPEKLFNINFFDNP